MNELQLKTTETFDEVHDRYTEMVNEAVSFTCLDVDFFTKVKANYLLWLARRALGKTKDLAVLDIGCGVGNFHPLLRSHVRRLDGVDVSADSLERAAAANPEVRYQVYEGTTLPYEEGQFDLVFAICVMHHVPPENWARFSDQMLRVLRPGGMAVVFEHNPLNPLTMRTVNNCPFDEDAVLLKSSQLTGLFREAGFEAITTRFILSVPPAGKVLFGLDRAFSRLPFGAQYYVAGRKPSVV